MTKTDVNHTISNSDVNKTESLWFIFNGQQLLVTHTLEVPTQNHKFIQHKPFVRQLFLEHTNTHYIAAELDASVTIPMDMQWLDLKKLYPLLPSNIMALAGKARQLIEWDKAHQFCGECNAKTDSAPNEHARICSNTHCHRIFYPNISPVIIVAIERGSEILLARSLHFPPNVYSVLAGFMTPGESVEMAIHREVFEEVGIKIQNLRYFGSQSWPFPSSLMLGFQADYHSGHIVCDPTEIEEANFFHINALPEMMPGNISISQWLIQDFCKRNQL